MEVSEFTKDLVVSELANYEAINELHSDLDELDKILDETNKQLNQVSVYKLEKIELTDTYFLTRIVVSVLALNGSILPSKLYSSNLSVNDEYGEYETKFYGDIYICIGKDDIDKFVKAVEQGYQILDYSDVTNSYDELEIVEHNKIYIK